MRQYLLFFIFVLTIPLAFAEFNQVGSDELYTPENNFMDNVGNRIAMIIPAILLFVSFICAMVDFGAEGVTIAAMLIMVVLNVFGIVAMSIYSLTTYLILGGILIFKITR